MSNTTPSQRIKRHPLSWCLHLIQDIYTALYAVHPNKKNATFGHQLYCYFQKRYGLKSMVDVHCLEMMENFKRGKDCIEIKQFLSFLYQKYSMEECQFFLYVRSKLQVILYVK